MNAHPPPPGASSPEPAPIVPGGSTAPDGPTAPGGGLPRAVRRGLLWGLLLAAIGFVVVATLLAPRAGRPEVLPLLGSVPDFRLTNRDGRAVARVDLAGHPWVADLLFTRCTLICPAMSSRMAGLDRRLPEAVHLVSFSVDPDHDTPEVLERYAERFEATGRWWMLTGDTEGEIHRLARQGLKLGVDRAPAGTDPGQAVVHSDRFVLVDAAGRIRGYYDPFDRAEMERLERDARALAAAGDGS